MAMLRDQYRHLPLVPTVDDCAGGTFIVTGANTGLGFEAAKHLVQLQSKQVIIAVRSPSKGEAAKAKIEAETGRKGVIEVWQLDLASFESVKDFAMRVNSLDRVDAIIENAGIATTDKTLCEGLESTITVNVVSTILLASLVLPKLQQVAKQFNITPHVAIVGSEVFANAKGELEKLDGDILEALTQGPMDKMYPTSKLLLLYAVRELASRRPVSETGVVINYVNPGLCKTELSRNASFAVRLLIGATLQIIGRSAEAGSRNLLYGAVTGKESHGKYTSDCMTRDYRVKDWVTNSYGQDIQRRVWECISRKLNAVQTGWF